jgi:hypothetical protein
MDGSGYVDNCATSWQVHDLSTHQSLQLFVSMKMVNLVKTQLIVV